ncbi:MAG TPA: squalene/phytoene synthase family protein [Steroidobacteraceae bacterium]|jgi:phytoene synthase|nr:squalene/phytoene synthase family protein [Steroidobacteraceae bacterium]
MTPTLDPTYRARAVPAGSARYWSWLFASSAARAPLLGVFALQAEWNALMDPATEPGAARLKLAWWQEEIRRLVARKPVHPIGGYLLSLPRAAEVDFAPLALAIDAAVAEASGVPLERGTELELHASALRGAPLAVASRLTAAATDEAGLQHCVRSLAVADYLVRAARDYRQDARFGRVPFAVDELLAADIDNTDLCAAKPPDRLARYLQKLRERALLGYQSAARVLPAACRPQQRHLLVLASLGSNHLERSAAALESGRMRDMLLAWSTARRAHG